MRLAIVKPDHIGDFVLSVPAITAISREHHDLTLMVSSKTLSLAQHLFPDIETQIMDMPHLMKGHAPPEVPDLSSFEVVLFLRRDGVITPEWAKVRTREFVMFEESHMHHQSILDYSVASEVVLDYDMDALFYGHRLTMVRSKALKPPIKVGLSIGSGFFTNSWPLSRWIETGRMLQADGREIYIVGGPAELVPSEMLARSLGLNRSHLIIGGRDFGTFFGELDELDLVIASDGGTGHLCSLSNPMISLFGSSPIHRYAPFGRWNRAISLMLPCSPCCQYAQREANGCLSVECISEIDSNDVRAAMNYEGQGRPRSYSLDIGRGRTLFIGLSHLDQMRKMAERRSESDLWAI